MKKLVFRRLSLIVVFLQLTIIGFNQALPDSINVLLPPDNCSCTLTAGPDLHLCLPGGILLQAAITGLSYPLWWYDADGLDWKDKEKLNPFVTPTENTTYHIEAHCLSTTNLLVNSEFSTSLPTGFYSDYTYDTFPGNFMPGHQTITNTPSLFNSTYQDCPDHSPGSDNKMLVVNGSEHSSETVWCETAYLIADSCYQFEVFVTALNSVNLPHISLQIDGVIYGALEPTSNTCTWNVFPIIFLAPGGFTEVCVLDLIDDDVGNDFALDDITLKKVCKLKDSVTVFIDHSKATFLTGEICKGQIYKFGNEKLSKSGKYLHNLVTQFGCDSLVYLDLEVIDVATYIETPPNMLDCNNPVLKLESYGSSIGPFYNYYWSTKNGSIETDPTLKSVYISKAGKYKLNLTYYSGGLLCKDSATIDITSDFELPVITAGPDGKLTCKDSVLTLNAEVYLPKSDYSVKWTTNSGYITSADNIIKPEISGKGIYLMTVTNESNGCTATDEVVILEDPGKPKAVITGDKVLTCLIDSILLDSKGSDVGSQYSHAWSTPDGNILSPTNLDKVFVNKAGTYNFTVTDNSKGCKTVASITVVDVKDYPIIDAGLNDTLSCLQLQTLLNGNKSIPDAISDITWTTIKGTILTGVNTLTPEVKYPGLYYLSVKNKLNGCITIDSVEVVKDSNFPIAITGNDDTINCIKNLVVLNSKGSTQGPNIELFWTAINGNIIGPNNTQTAITDVEGTYLLKVTNNLNGCIEFDTVRVFKNIKVPSIDILNPAKLTCNLIELDINGSGSSTGPEINYIWSTINGNILNGISTSIATIDKPGQYNLLIVDKTNGCSIKDSVIVLQDIDAPNVNINVPGILNCKLNSEVLSIVNNKPNLILKYDWSTQGGKIDSGPGTSSPTISKAGTYTLITTNSANGCTDEDKIDVNFNGELPIVKAGQDSFINCCNPILKFNGGFTHTNNNVNIIWSSLNGNIISGQNTLNAQVNSFGTYILKVIDPISGCVGEDTLLVTEDKTTPQSALTNPGKLTCDLDKLTINLTNTDPSWSYLWSTAAGNIQGTKTGSAINITSSGYYKVNIYNQINCCAFEDSIPISEDKVFPIIDAGPQKLLTCKDTIVSLNGSIYNSNNQESKQWYTYKGNILSSSDILNPKVNSEAYYFLSVTNKSNGCKSIDSVYVLKNKNLPVDILADLHEPGCNTVGSIEITGVEGGSGPYLYSINGSTFEPLNEYKDLVPGYYLISTIDFNGCLTKKQFYIPDPQDIELSLPDEITVQWEDSTILTPVLKGIKEEDIASILWIPGKWLSCDTCFSPYITHATNTEKYTVFVTDKYGCKAEAQIRIFIVKEFNVYFPNIFSPNDDQINDKWFIFADPNKIKKIFKVQIFDRWGELMWEVNDLVPSLNPDIGWDGIFRGNKLNPGVFVYWTYVEFADGKRKVLKGDITLIR